jgi:hypothetical protein
MLQIVFLSQDKFSGNRWDKVKDKIKDRDKTKDRDKDKEKYHGGRRDEQRGCS